MIATEIQRLRRETKKYIDLADERVLRLVLAMLEADAERGQPYLSPKQEALLNEHIELYEKGEMQFSSWQDVRSRIAEKIRK